MYWACSQCVLATALLPGATTPWQGYDQRVRGTGASKNSHKRPLWPLSSFPLSDARPGWDSGIFPKWGCPSKSWGFHKNPMVVIGLYWSIIIFQENCCFGVWYYDDYHFTIVYYWTNSQLSSQSFSAPSCHGLLLLNCQCSLRIPRLGPLTSTSPNSATGKIMKLCSSWCSWT